MLSSSKTVCCLCSLSICSTITALLLLSSAVTLVLVFPTVLEHQVEERVILQEGSATLEQFLNPSVPIYKDIYFFNLTNPEQFQAGSKPNLSEIGPYSYSEIRTKTLLNISDDGTLLTFNQTRLFHFNQETSGEDLKESDMICTINLPLVAAVAQLQRAMDGGDGGFKGISGDFFLRFVFNKTNAQLYVCQPASLLAWNYTDDLVEELNSNLVLKGLNMNYPRTFVSIQVNNSVNDSLPSVIYTGAGNIHNIGRFVQWKGNVGSVEIWPNGMGANNINGTEGLLFQPLLQGDEELEVFVEDAIRSFQLVPIRRTGVNGIEGLEYQLPNSTFESAFTNSQNARWGSWCPDGMFFLGHIQFPEVPVFGSKPHFLDGDPELLERVSGLRPNRDLHESRIVVEPLTGANLQFQTLIQINAQVNKSDNFPQLENIDGTIYVPIMYINEHSIPTQEFTQFLLNNGLGVVRIYRTLVWVSFGILLCLTVVAIVIAGIACTCTWRRWSKNKTYIQVPHLNSPI